MPYALQILEALAPLGLAPVIIWVQENTTWGYFMRTVPRICVREEQPSQPIRVYPMAKGQVFQRSQFGFTQSAEVTLNLIGWWSSRYEEPFYLVTNISNACQASKYYLRRFQIETFFSDQKSRGFQIHKSLLSDPARLVRMVVAACLAYLRMICQGIWVIATHHTGLIDRTDRVDKSLFRLGLDWIKFALIRNVDFNPVFRLQPLESTGNAR